MTGRELLQVYGLIGALWPARLVDPLPAENVDVVARTLFDDVPLAEALVVVDEFARRSSPFPPSWPELREQWQARAAGVGGDPDTIVSLWLAEVNAEVGRKGGTFYRPMPEFSDPIVGQAVIASGGWREWGMTPTGGVGEGGAFMRNLVPERDARFRQAARAMLLHRRRTGERLPEIVERAAQQRVEPGTFQRLLERGGE